MALQGRGHTINREVLELVVLAQRRGLLFRLLLDGLFLRGLVV